MDAPSGVKGVEAATAGAGHREPTACSVEACPRGAVFVCGRELFTFSCLQPLSSVHSFATPIAWAGGEDGERDSRCPLIFPPPPWRPPAPLRLRPACVSVPGLSWLLEGAVPEHGGAGSTGEALSPKHLSTKERQVLKDRCPPFSPVGGTLPHSLVEGPEITFQTDSLYRNPCPRVCLDKDQLKGWVSISRNICPHIDTSPQIASAGDTCFWRAESRRQVGCVVDIRLPMGVGSVVGSSASRMVTSQRLLGALIKIQVRIQQVWGGT